LVRCTNSHWTVDYLCDMATAMVVEPEHACGPRRPTSFMASAMATGAVGNKMIAAPLTPTAPAVAAQSAATFQTLGFRGYPRVASSQQIYPVIQPPRASASRRAGSETCTSADRVAAARSGTSSVPLGAPALPAGTEQAHGAARLSTRGILKEAAELAALKVVSARRDARIQHLEAELRQKDAAIKARDEEITRLKRRCEELQRRSQCASPFNITHPQPSSDDRLDQVGSELELQTPRPLLALRQSKAALKTTGDEKCLPGYSRWVSSPPTKSSIAWSDLEEEIVLASCDSAAQRGTADELTPGGNSALKVCGTPQRVGSVLGEGRATSPAASNLSPRVRRNKDSK